MTTRIGPESRIDTTQNGTMQHGTTHDEERS